MEYVEVRGKSVEVALEAALEELGIERDRADIEVIQEPEKGFLGMGGRDAVVRVKVQAQQKRRRRRRRGGEGEERPKGPANSNRGDRQPSRQRPEKKPNNEPRTSSEPRKRRDDGAKTERPVKEENQVSIEEQTPVVESFLKGLVDAFGLEGSVEVTTEEDVIVATVSGPQTEAMVGPRGSTIEAIHELTKTVLQRQTQASARVRLDIAGYGERRRQALAIYADQLIDQVLREGGEVMLEPMSAGDRKTIHDAVAQRPGVRSYSEGEAPQRFVVIAQEAGDSEEE